MQLSNYTTLREISRAYAINYYTVRHRVKTRKIRIIRMGWMILVPKSAVVRVVDGKKKIRH